LYHGNKTENIEGKKAGYSIGIVSRKVNLSQKTLREYEKMGLIRPRREPRTNNRIYSDFEIAQVKHITRLIHREGFTLPCLRRIVQLAPCWNIFHCEVKDRCAAYKYPSIPCYKIRKDKGSLCTGSCEQCAVFINSTSKREKVLERPVSEQ